MKSDSERLRARDYVAGLAASGRYHFTSNDARKALAVSPEASKLALNRLARQKLIASPSRGFYVVVPPEYQSLGCLPPDQFIPALMELRGQRYYAGLLSAAQYHGAAHHRPQEFQVLVAKALRPIYCGQVRVAFVVRKRLEDVPVRSFNTPRGTILVSTPEATAIDLVGYHKHAGGLDQVTTVLSELAEQLDPQELVVAARTAPLPWAQRLGYLLEQIGASEKTSALRNYVKDMAREATLLLPAVPAGNAQRDAVWKLVINADVQAEL